MRKKIITILLMTALSASMLAGCGNKDADKNATATEAGGSTDTGTEADNDGTSDNEGLEPSGVDSTEEEASADADHQAYVDEVLAAYQKYIDDNGLYGVGAAEIGTEGKIYLWEYYGFYKYENGEVVRVYENDFFDIIEEYENFLECRISEDKKIILLRVDHSMDWRYYIMDADTLELKDVIHDKHNLETMRDEIWYESNPDEKWVQEEIVNHPMIIELEKNDFPKRIYWGTSQNDVYKAYEMSQSNAGVTW